MQVNNDHHNPKLDENPGSNTEKDPENWVSGDDPMTGAQASYPRRFANRQSKSCRHKI